MRKAGSGATVCSLHWGSSGEEGAKQQCNEKLEIKAWWLRDRGGSESSLAGAPRALRCDARNSELLEVDRGEDREQRSVRSDWSVVQRRSAPTTYYEPGTRRTVARLVLRLTRQYAATRERTPFPARSVLADACGEGLGAAVRHVR